MKTMTCPNCSAPLVIVDRLDVEIDYCPDCRGVWLDRGELDKIIARSGAGAERDRPVYRERPPERQPERRHYDDDHKPHKKKRENFFEELFDF